MKRKRTLRMCVVAALVTLALPVGAAGAMIPCVRVGVRASVVATSNDRSAAPVVVDAGEFTPVGR